MCVDHTSLQLGLTVLIWEQATPTTKSEFVMQAHSHKNLDVNCRFIPL